MSQQLVRYNGVWVPTTKPDVLFPVENVPLHPTYGDEFAEPTLDPKWNSLLRSGTRTHQASTGSSVFLDWSANGSLPGFIAQNATALANSNFEVIASCQVLSTSRMTGLLFYDSNNTGRLFSVYNDANSYWWSIVSAAYSSTLATLSNTGFSTAYICHWLRVVKSGTTYTAYRSVDGLSWGSGVAITWAGPLVKIGFGYAYTPGTPAAFLHRFNVRILP